MRLLARLWLWTCYSCGTLIDGLRSRPCKALIDGAQQNVCHDCASADIPL